MSETFTVKGDAAVQTTTIIHPGGGITLLQTARVDLGTSADIGIRTVGAWHMTRDQALAMLTARKAKETK